MRSNSWILAIGIAMGLVRPAIAAPTYPTYLTEPLTMAPHDQGYYRDLFLTMAKLVSAKQDGEKILVLVLRLLKNTDDDDYTVCGEGMKGEVNTDRKDVLFAYTHKTMYAGFDWNTWRQLGCQTRGGTFIESKVRKGSTDLYFVASHDPIPTKVVQPAVPPDGPLPLGRRQRIAIEFEDRLSQILGAQVTLLSDRSYKEQDGSSTSCTVGIVGGHRFRIAESGDAKPLINPKQAQWIAAGCTRPGYQLIR
jgi:hypothetical protein